MASTMDRRTFIRSAGSGLFLAAAVPIVEPVRRFWQVGAKLEPRAHFGDWEIYAERIATMDPDESQLIQWARVIGKDRFNGESENVYRRRLVVALQKPPPGSESWGFQA